jgi:type 1 glutamine amidotransferase
VQILVCCDDKWHPAEIPRTGLAPLAEQGFVFDWLEDGAAWSTVDLTKYAAVILVKANNISPSDPTPWMTEAVQADLWRYVQTGKGLLALHSGTAGYKEATQLRALLGGVFLNHPAQCLVTVEPSAHPLTSGVEPFTEKDEHYFMAVDDPAVDIFLHSRSEHGVQPAGWRRREGAGRVCVLTPGHNLPVWLQPAYQRLLLNTLQWCADGA